MNATTPHLSFESLVIHGGQAPEPATGAIMPPIFATSTYVQEAPGVHKGYEYARSQNPTRTAFENALVELEGGAQAFAFSSGLAAAATVLELLEGGSHLIAGEDLYGGTGRLFEQVRARSANLQTTFLDLHDLEGMKHALRPNTRMLWVESPTNPTLRVYDLPALVEFSRTHGLILVVDNTFATPWLQQPLALGADLVLHSTTKYLNGHSDMVGGAVIVGRDTPRADLASRLAFLQNAVGSIPGPFDCFLALRGLKTLAIRMERHCRNAMTLAEWLQSQEGIERVIYPGLPSHPDHALAARQMKAFGGMISLTLKGGDAAARRFLSSLKLFALAESLGGVESLASQPIRMTHGSVPKERRDRLGITEGLVRLSVGIEGVEDLKADLLQALRQL
ncbi:MAG: PLP-dependent aspartate aminotransferase family protein [Holophaga sp.]|nr:PLP-dependent aspartate aminotransferase family protein [Holophaga sp.]